MRDGEVFDIINDEYARQRNGIELIASENYVSRDVMDAVGSVLTNKYAEGYPGKRYYGGCEFVDKLEQLAVGRARQLFNVNYVNVQPHSGTQANASVITSILKPGGRILSLGLEFGGHLTHGSSVSFSGKLYKAYHYGVSKDTGVIDIADVERIADKAKPNLIIVGASAYSRDWDYKRFREVADSCKAILMADIAHPAGIIACGKLNDPFDYCHVVTTTTHKTLRGPRGGMIMMRKDFENPIGAKDSHGHLKMMSSLIDSSVFPGNQGGPLMHVIAGKAVSFLEALSQDYRDYIDNVCLNAQCLASCFIDGGYSIVSGGTQNHMMLIDLHNKGLTGLEAEIALDKAGITVNKNMVPYDDKSAGVASGIRIGTPAITTRGFKQKECEKVYGYIDEVLRHRSNDSYLKRIKDKIKDEFADFVMPV